MVIRLAFETLIWFTVVEYVPDAVHCVFENRGCGKYDHSDLWINKGNDVESRNKSGDLTGKAEVFERFHDKHCLVSTIPKFLDHAHQRHNADDETD